MGRYRALILTIIVVAAVIGAIGWLILTQFPGLVPTHTIRAH